MFSVERDFESGTCRRVLFGNQMNENEPHLDVIMNDDYIHIQTSKQKGILNYETIILYKYFKRILFYQYCQASFKTSDAGHYIFSYKIVAVGKNTFIRVKV